MTELGGRIASGAPAPPPTLRERLTPHLPSGGLIEDQRGEISVTLPLEQLLPLLQALRDGPALRFSVLVDVCGVDYPDRVRRFDVVYHLLSPTLNERVRIKVQTGEDTPVPSVTSLWPAAGWFEREAYDLVGVLFAGHPDLRRLLTDYGFEGHPLRKDFPLTGYVEVRWDDAAKRVVYEPVQLRQDLRSFDFLSPWEGEGGLLPGDEKGAVR